MMKIEVHCTRDDCNWQGIIDINPKITPYDNKSEQKRVDSEIRYHQCPRCNLHTLKKS